MGCQIDPNRGILVDIEAVDVKTLIKALTARQAEVLTQRKQVIAEKVGNLIGDELGEIVREAVSAYLRLEKVGS